MSLMIKMIETSKIGKANTGSSSIRITIPKKVLEELDLKIGDTVTWKPGVEKGKKFFRVEKLE